MSFSRPAPRGPSGDLLLFRLLFAAGRSARFPRSTTDCWFFSLRRFSLASGVDGFPLLFFGNSSGTSVNCAKPECSPGTCFFLGRGVPLCCDFCPSPSLGFSVKAYPFFYIRRAVVLLLFLFFYTGNAAFEPSLPIRKMDLFSVSAFFPPRMPQLLFSSAYSSLFFSFFSRRAFVTSRHLPSRSRFLIHQYFETISSFPVVLAEIVFLFFVRDSLIRRTLLHLL